MHSILEKAQGSQEIDTDTTPIATTPGILTMR